MLADVLCLAIYSCFDICLLRVENVTVLGFHADGCRILFIITMENIDNFN